MNPKPPLARALRLILTAWLAMLATAGLAAQPLDLDDTGHQQVWRHMEILLDPQGSMELAAVRRAHAEGRFHAAPSQSASLGYLPGAAWVRLAIRNPGTTARSRWLQQHWVFQQSSILFVVRGDGTERRFANGAEVPLDHRPVQSRLILFPLEMAAGEVLEVYGRLSGRSATVVDFDLWHPADFLDSTALQAAVKFFLLGGSLVAMAYSVLAWHLLRRNHLLAVAGGHLVFVLVVFILDGYAANWVPMDGQLWPARLLFATVFVALAFHSVFARGFLALPSRFPRLARLMTLATLACLAGAVASLVSFHPAWMTKLQILTIVAILASAVRAVPGGGASARAYLVAWIVLWGTIILRALLLLGEFPAISFLNMLPALGFLGSVLALTYAMHVDIRAMRDAGREAEAGLLAQQRGEQERLSEAVEARTRELRDAIARSEQASQAKSSFLSVVSHELRTPLHTILGYSHLLRRQSTPDIADKLAIIEHSGEHLLRLIEQVLEFTRGGQRSIELDPEPCRLQELAEDLENTGRILARTRGNRFSLVRGGGLPAEVEADRQRLTQVLQNLIGNACKYTENGSVRLLIEPSTEHASGGERQCAMHFAVEDTGCGIASPDLDRIFDPFTRIASRQRQPGLGLGLAISREWVRAMGGEISVTSAPGQGSRFEFTVSFPVLADRSAPATGHAAGLSPVVGHRGRQRRILVADDIADNRIFLRELCQRWGFAVTEARDGAEAWALCEGATPPVDLVLADQFMPGVDGWDLLRRIRSSERLAALPVILVSAAPATAPEEFPEHWRFDAVLLKPFPQESLEQAIADALTLDWIRAGEAPEPPPEERAAALPPDKAIEFRSMVELGRIVALRHWCAQLKQDHPECGDFAEKAENLARRIDLPGLRDLVAGLPAPP
ncbi:MAG TPA: ATP-binding protein [Rhodocyclaceae bacterium]|nr:ATP-binding protein [Rhodocyclaceae bacterium]HNH35470.1 ATP-binding protein [Rhodocyclaceae bacterium]